MRALDGPGPGPESSAGVAIGSQATNAESDSSISSFRRFLNHHLGSLDPNDVSGHDVSGLLEGLRLEHGPADLAGQAVPSKPRQHQASTAKRPREEDEVESPFAPWSDRMLRQMARMDLAEPQTGRPAGEAAPDVLEVYRACLEVADVLEAQCTAKAAELGMAVDVFRDHFDEFFASWFRRRHGDLSRFKALLRQLDSAKLPDSSKLPRVSSPEHATPPSASTAVAAGSAASPSPPLVLSTPSGSVPMDVGVAREARARAEAGAGGEAGAREDRAQGLREVRPRVDGGGAWAASATASGGVEVGGAAGMKAPEGLRGVVGPAMATAGGGGGSLFSGRDRGRRDADSGAEEEGLAGEGGKSESVGPGVGLPLGAGVIPTPGWGGRGGAEPGALGPVAGTGLKHEEGLSVPGPAGAEGAAREASAEAVRAVRQLRLRVSELRGLVRYLLVPARGESAAAAGDASAARGLVKACKKDALEACLAQILVEVAAHHGAAIEATAGDAAGVGPRGGEAGPTVVAELARQLQLSKAHGSDTSGGILPTHIVARVVLARSARLSSQAVQSLVQELESLDPGGEDAEDRGAIGASTAAELCRWFTACKEGGQPGMGRMWTARAGRGGAAAGLTLRFERLLDRLGIAWPMCSTSGEGRVCQALRGE